VSVVVVAHIRPRPECREEVKAAFVEAIVRVHAEDDGCEVYALHETDDSLVMIEKWASPDLLATHGAADALTRLREQLQGKLLGPLEVTRMSPVPAGDPIIGVV
jgi:quinol monooxygenase YgiN